mmetsp:Transcript_4678/g.4430  ORF Transcript_4678/g.4430 Transcript_4678/m.4430 type:complete len:643 (-) Transcript_4678:143-2071(-)
MKKVDEGVELFDEIWEKVYSAEQQNQKEKYEVDLKKEIKKLQRLRDQIKTWIGSSDVKDKDALLHARRLIETKMEQFKVCEKETKTKTYSKEGLARQEKLSPEEEAKENTCKWIAEIIDQLNQLVDDRDVEIERLSTGKGKKSNKHIIDEYNEFISNHKYHISKLEGIMRLVMNDRIPADIVNELKEDLEYYVEAHEDDEYIQGYDEEIFYETLGLDEMDVVNVDRVTQAPSVSSKSKNDDASTSSSQKKDKKMSKKLSAASSMIPLTIGRARTINAKKEEKETSTPTKAVRSSSAGSNGSTGPSLGPAPTARAPPPPNHSGGASMAAVLKREGEQQEKERQKQAAIQQAQQQRLLQEQQARAQAEQLRQQQLQRQQQEQLQRQQEAIRQKEAQEKAMQEALQRQQQQMLQDQQRQQEATKQQQLQAQKKVAQQQRTQQSSSSSGGTIDLLLNSGLGGLSLGNIDANAVNGQPAVAITPQPVSSAPTPSGPSAATYDATASYLGALNESFLHCPSNLDSERTNTYNPRNPYPTPSSYPSAPSSIFDNPVVFEKLGTDCLFFIFYYAQGTYHQYLAARELKKQSWRYHKKYMTWFQRHEEPKVTTDEYEQGTYVYFDYETGWCQRIKSDFRFEYSYLEDSLQI